MKSLGLLKISHSIKQPFSSVCLKEELEIHQNCLSNEVLFTKEDVDQSDDRL